MRWYWTVSCDNSVEKPFVSTTGDLKGIDGFDLHKGLFIKDWDKNSWIKAADPEYDGDPDDVLQNHLGIPIYSSRLQDVIAQHNFEGIQLLPIKVRHCDDTELEGFAIANILNTPPAMDLALSDYKTFSKDYFLQEKRGHVSMVKRMVLKSSDLKELDLVRVSQYLSSVFASERFKDAFESVGCTGYSFKEVETSVLQ